MITDLTIINRILRILIEIYYTLNILLYNTIIVIYRQCNKFNESIIIVKYKPKII